MKGASIEGGCFCGAVRFSAESPPGHSMICHCRTCRRVAGSPVVAWVTFPKEEFRFTRGSPGRFSSSEPVSRTFCRDCGTPLTYEHAKSPGFVDVTTCCLDTPERFPPTHHSWLSHDIAWIRFGDGLPTFPQSRSE